jgi:hypothetical protein
MRKQPRHNGKDEKAGAAAVLHKGGKVREAPMMHPTAVAMQALKSGGLTQGDGIDWTP